MTEIDRTHDAAATSWVETANGHGDFPLQNLPFAVFRMHGSNEAFRGGVAIGDHIVDMAALARAGLFESLAQQAAEACALPRLNSFFGLGPAAWRALRHALFDALHVQATQALQDRMRPCLVEQAAAEFSLPVAIGDYTDFYTSVDHALNIGRQVRPDDPLSPNFRWMPIAYHGRVSSIGLSGQRVRRPMGQWLPTGASAPVYGACEKLDYELELGIYIGTGNPQGEPIAMADAEDHVFGLCLLNDWSARDIQRWETVPLGPFQSKNFATTVSPWIVTLDALAPYRQPRARPAGEPQPLPHLDHARNRAEGGLDIQLEVLLRTPLMQAQGRPAQRLSRTSFRHQYWTIGQMVAHHTAGGCNLQGGDLLGSGTISGPGTGEAGALIELSVGGTRPVLLGGAEGNGKGEQRGFLEDGDTVSLRGWCDRPGFARIGFGHSTGTVTPAIGRLPQAA
jgi:fumarylacetoacetase